jgi:hypothetical protein
MFSVKKRYVTEYKLFGQTEILLLWESRRLGMKQMFD